jgi:hypothetical protein
MFILSYGVKFGFFFCYRSWGNGAMEIGVFKFKNLTLGYDKPWKISKIQV